MKHYSRRIGLGILTATLALLLVNAATFKLVDAPPNALHAAPPAPMTAVILPSVAAVTPNPTATLEPDTTVVISTDFGACNTIATARVSSRCEDGKNILRLEQSGITGWIRYPNAYADTLVEVTASARSNDLTNYGVILRAADDESAYYLVGLQNDGKYGVYYFDGSYTALVPYVAASGINTGAAANRLKIINQGPQIAVYVNDEWVATLKHERLIQGRVGLFVEGSHPGVEAVYDDLRVSKINRPLEIVEPDDAPTQPAPTATQPPSAQTDTTPVIQDDFGSCEGFDDAYLRVRCQGGEYVIHRKDNQATRWVQWRNQFGDAVVEVTGRATDNALTRYGVVLRNNADGSKFYLVSLQNDGKYGVFAYDKAFIQLRPYTSSPAVKPGTAANRIRIVNQGPALALYLNDQWIDTFRDERAETLTQGQFALFVEGSNPTPEAAFDNLRVSTINRPLEIPAPRAVSTPVPPATQMPPSPAPTPTPGETTLLANINYDKCTTIENERIHAFCAEGKLSFTKRGENFFEWLAYTFNLANAIYEVETKVLESAPDLAYGLLVRLNAENAGYLFALNPDGEYGLWRIEDDEFQELVPFTYSDAITDGPNRLKVIAQDDQLALYINDEFVELVGGVESEPGRVGLYLESDEPRVTVAFDNLRVARINRPLALGEPEDKLCELNEGEAGILLNNGFDAPMTFTIGGGGWGTHDYEIPGDGEWYILAMPPGRYTYTAFIPGVGTAHGERFDYAAGVCRRIRFTP